MPKGRKTEDGILPEKYQLKEMPTASYRKRTEKNVVESDGTLILSHGKLTGGSALTLKHSIEILNVAGARASKDPKIINKKGQNRIVVASIDGRVH